MKFYYLTKIDKGILGIKMYIYASWNPDNQTISFALMDKKYPKNFRYYMSKAIMSCSFKFAYISDINDNSDFFLNDLLSIKSFGENNTYKFSSTRDDRFAILTDNIYIKNEIKNEDKMIESIFIRIMCHNFNYLLNKLRKKLKTPQIANEDIIAYRGGFPEDPEKASEEKYDSMYKDLYEKIVSAGFICTNDYHGFENSVGFVYLNTASMQMLTNFYKKLYHDSVYDLRRYSEAVSKEMVNINNLPALKSAIKSHRKFSFSKLKKIFMLKKPAISAKNDDTE